MPARHGSRFALEAGFLILLAVLAGLADLRWQAIVLVMGIAWLLIALLEWAFWRDGPRVSRGHAAWSPPVALPPAPPVHVEPPPLPAPPPREEATRIIEPGELAEAEEAPGIVETDAVVAEPEPEPEEPEQLEEEPGPEAVEEPPPKRPWWWRR